MSDTLPKLIDEVQNLCITWSKAMDKLIVQEGIDTTEWDWPAVAYLNRDLPNTRPEPIMLEKFFEHPLGKETLFEQALPTLIVEQDIQQIILVATAWAVVNKPGSPSIEEIPVSQHPDRIEVVSLVAIDADSIHTMHAEIKRTSDAAPTLGPWESMTSSDTADLTGRMIDPIRAAIKQATEGE
jgi:hypothetical protein